MTTPHPFVYSPAILARRHGPRSYDPFGGYKPWLRDEFTFRCVYCLEREVWYPDRADSFSVDHLIPQSQSPALIGEYANLVYACRRCNSHRGVELTFDPAADIIADHIQLTETGVMFGLTPDGLRMITLLRLNESPALDVRRKYLDISELFAAMPANERIARLYMREFGYPHDMPDLRTLRPPGGNSNPGSEDACYFARAERGELPATY